MVRLLGIVLSGVLFACAASSQAQESKTDKGPAKLFLWKATSKTNTVYLLGSIHVASPEFYPLPDEIEKAFAQSRALVVEVDLTKVNQEELKGQLLQKGMYPGREVVGNHLPKVTYERLRQYLTNKGLEPAMMEKFKPWALAVTITMLEVQSLGYESELGIDQHFLKNAVDRKIVELESADEQVNVLSGLPEKLEAEFLASTLDSADKTADLMKKTVAAWKAGDAEALEKLLGKDVIADRPELRGVYTRLLDDRNEKMARKIEPLLKGKDPAFVVVGAGHLLGPKGILKLLEKRGFAVEQVTKAPAGAKADPKKPSRRGYAPADSWAK